jgi:hypothetical protein
MIRRLLPVRDREEEGPPGQRQDKRKSPKSCCLCTTKRNRTVIQQARYCSRSRSPNVLSTGRRWISGAISAGGDVGRGGCQYSTTYVQHPLSALCSVQVIRTTSFIGVVWPGPQFHSPAGVLAFSERQSRPRRRLWTRSLSQPPASSAATGAGSSFPC